MWFRFRASPNEPTLVNSIRRFIWFQSSLWSAVTTAVLMLAGCKLGSDPPAVHAAPPQVGVVTIHAQPVILTSELPGRTTAYRIADVRPQVNGLVLSRLFTEGDDVTAGQQLYQIDPAPYQASLDSARAAVQKARASVTSGRLTVARDRSLVQAFAVSKQDLDNDVATLQQDEADVASALASVETANINLAYTKVNSPISGRSGRSSVTEGALVTADQTTSLVTITQLDPIYVDVTQPVTTLLRLKRELRSGLIKRAGANQAEVHLILEDGTEYAEAGRLQFSEVNVDQDTGSVTLRAIFPNPDEFLLPGMFVRERIEEGVSADGLLVPQQGVTHDPQGRPTALIVDKDNKVENRILVADRAIGTNWLVTKGIAEGDRVIVEGVLKVAPGMVVTPEAEPVQTATADTGDDDSAAAGN
jgi:membrane fusion protein (multidrug efflux system)